MRILQKLNIYKTYLIIKNPYKMTKANTATEMQRLVYEMLIENTGRALCDSGDHYGRHYERNQLRTVQDFIKDSQVWFEPDFKEDEKADSLPSPTVSVFHYMSEALELDGLARKVNEFIDENDDDIETLKPFFESLGLSVQDDGWNTYNGDCNLSQTLQGWNVNLVGNESNFEFPEYVLISTHNGCDVRGGYSTAKLFKASEDYEYFTGNPSVYTSIKAKKQIPENQVNLLDHDAEPEVDQYELDTSYDGYSLSDGTGEIPSEEWLSQFTNKELAKELTKNAGFGA